MGAGARRPALCLLALVRYAVQFRGRHTGRAGLFGAAVALFFLALASPIGVLARGYLFSAHMLQHLLLMLAVPPLVLLGLPRPASGRAGDAARPREPGATVTAGSWLAGVGAMWIWHARPLCNAAAAIPVVQWLQTASLLVDGARVLAARPRAARSTIGCRRSSGILYLFAACVACTILGIIVTLSPVEVCSAYVHPVDALGVVPLLREGWGLSLQGRPAARRAPDVGPAVPRLRGPPSLRRSVGTTERSGARPRRARRSEVRDDERGGEAHAAPAGRARDHVAGRAGACPGRRRFRARHTAPRPWPSGSPCSSGGS